MVLIKVFMGNLINQVPSELKVLLSKLVNKFSITLMLTILQFVQTYKLK